MLAAPDVARFLRRAGDPDGAATVLSMASSLATGPAVIARLSAERALLDLDSGAETTHWWEAAAGMLALADTDWAAGHAAQAGGRLADALAIACHRTLHTDDLPSPITTDLDRWRGMLLGSRAYRALLPPRRLRPQLPWRSRRGARRIRVITADHHAGFLALPMQRWRDELHHDVVTVELARADLPNERALAAQRQRRAAGEPLTSEDLGNSGDALTGADTVIVEWCDIAAVWASLHLPEGTRLVIRLHSVEALSVHPHLVDWGRVDQLVVVSPALRRLARAAVPALRHVPTVVLPNAVALEGFQQPKQARAARTVALIGWAQPVKDPMFAAETLARLRSVDDSWRLLLIGRDWPEHGRARSELYRERWEARIAEPDLRGAIEQVPFTDDLASVLPEVGFVLSSSVREGWQVALIEAAASGAVPVVRDWPMIAPFGGPASFWPKAWVVRSPEEAAARVLRYADADERDAVGATVMREVLRRYAWPRPARRYDRSFLG